MRFAPDRETAYRTVTFIRQRALLRVLVMFPAPALLLFVYLQSLLTRIPFGAWLQNVYINKDYELSFVLHPEARDFENWANPDYYFTYDNPEVQALYAKSVAATDPDTAADFLKQAAKIVAEDQAADWLYNGASVVAVASGVTGFPSVNVNERLNLSELAKSQG